MSTTVKEAITYNIKDNIFLFIAAQTIPMILIFALGCESTVSSVAGNEEPVNRNELYAEVEAFLAMAEARFASLDKQDELKRILFQQSFTIAETGAINPLSLITSLGTIPGVGAIGDNVRKRKTISELKKSMIAPNVNSD